MARIRLGDYNQREVVKEVDFGMYLDAGDEGEVLLPKRYVPKGCKLGDMLNVFLYLDQDERLVATTETPLAKVGEFACCELYLFHCLLKLFVLERKGEMGCGQMGHCRHVSAIGSQIHVSKRCIRRLRQHREATFFTSIARYPCKVNTFPAFLRTFAQTANLIF